MSATKVDLSLAKPGDVLIGRNGSTEVFKDTDGTGEWPYRSESYEEYRRDGSWSPRRNEQSPADIVRVTRDGKIITPAPAKPAEEVGEKCCLCDSPMKDGSCTGDPDGCVMVVTDAPAAVIQGPKAKPALILKIYIDIVDADGNSLYTSGGATVGG